MATPPPSYGAIPSHNGEPYDAPNHRPPPYTPRSVAPGPPPRPPGILNPSPPRPQPIPSPPPRPLSVPHPPPRPPNRPYPTPRPPTVYTPLRSHYTPYHAPGPSSRNRTSTCISPGLIGIVTILIQIVVIVSGSGSLIKAINLESAALNASRERVALVAWRVKSEREREQMRRDRELWGKVREDRVPQGAYWEVVWPAWDCHAYGKREYWGTLRNIPEGWSAIDACMNMPVEIKGVTVRRPYRCAFVDGDPHIHGYWMVDWDQPDCKPWYRDFHDAVSPRSSPPARYCHAYTFQGCTSYGSGARRIEAQLVGINKRKEQDWWLLCSTTPMLWNEIMYTSPTHCELRVSGFPFRMLSGSG
jgi:hypothetical protein